MTATVSELDERVLMRAATAKDATMARAVLERANLIVHICPDIEDLVREMARGVGVLVLAEEAIGGDKVEALKAGLTAQGEWSDVPVIVLARQGADSRAITHIMDEFANVTVIERPMRMTSFVSAIRTALRARRRQYELRGLLAGLREADQRKTEFLATLAHELRNPLAPMSSALTLLTLKKPTPEDAVKYYQLMGRQVDHMVRLVDDLLEVSRITRGKIELRKEPVVLDAVIQDAVELSRPLFERSAHTLKVDLAGEALVLHGDAVRLTQVFSNLLNNAAKYTPPGGQVSIVARASGRQVLVEVTDNGAGIEAPMLASIFEMFVQVSDTSRAAQGGLGIGLTLVKALVELHGGRVSASSAGLGHGATFSVWLPLSNAAANAQRRPLPYHEGGSPLRERAILVVDDNVDAANALGELLSSLGASVLIAYGGEEALGVARTNDFDAAVLDLGMPGLDGFELARRLRAEQPARKRTFIALTGWSQQGYGERISKAGFDHHLLKPVSLADLLRVLQGN
ncbi:ATP-binding protein [Variovorax sp. OV329]|uniref:hybrid sensor histidine kinase/response regulator n=1 Tax=Variovorax sp. OV329 TaxID=1882825 RepID=UPI0008E2F2D4|nr:ATP-binding protein [Variovorax sp. OV329]SFN41460.1 His Kinase A (phospho-acceptor) domain-containing protein [Variovorax sp. OV329]